MAAAFAAAAAAISGWVDVSRMRLLRAGGMTAVAADFRFVRSRFLAQLTAVFFSRRRNADAG